MNRTSHGPAVPKAFSFAFICFALLSAFSTLSVSAQNEKPEIINNVPKDIPLKVEIIEPPTADEYPEGIRIKVTNTGDKPIYSIRMFLDIDDPEKKVYGPDGKLTGFTFKLNYGRKELTSSYMEPPVEGDIPIKPKETHVFTVSKYYAKILRKSFNGKGLTQARFYRLRFHDLSFGDSTGFAGESGKPVPSKKN